MSGVDSLESADVIAADIAAAAQLACLLEASAPKPGNVSPARRFNDIGYEHFLASAAAIGAPLSQAGRRPVGVTIRLAIEATARWTRSNTNLGIVLLLAPLARAAFALARGHGAGLETIGEDAALDAAFRGEAVGGKVVSGFGRTSAASALRAELRGVLEATTVGDARETYAAIRRAGPSGLGRADSQDVSGDLDVTLLEAMRLAADRDGIAREYATWFDRTFTTGFPALARASDDRLSWDEAVLETFLTLLAAAADTHVARRAGTARADEISRHARSVLAAGGIRTAAGRREIADMDAALADERHLANPGTTADLTAAAIFVFLLSGGWTSVSG
jgi:triphosphoribosyl-dephospho-CoA synthase